MKPYDTCLKFDQQIVFIKKGKVEKEEYTAKQNCMYYTQIYLVYNRSSQTIHSIQCHKAILVLVLILWKLWIIFFLIKA